MVRIREIIPPQIALIQIGEILKFTHIYVEINKYSYRGLSQLKGPIQKITMIFVCSPSHPSHPKSLLSSRVTRNVVYAIAFNNPFGDKVGFFRKRPCFHRKNFLM